MRLDVGLGPGCDGLAALCPLPAVHVGTKACDLGPQGSSRVILQHRALSRSMGTPWTHPYQLGSVLPLQEKV